MPIYCAIYLNTVIIVTLFKFGNADSRDLPVIHPGHPCKEGQVYRSECNTCLCGPKNTLTCTTMACIKGVDYERSSQSNTERKVRTKDVKRQGNTKKCKPGMIEDKLSTCQICYCNFLSQFHCNTLTPQQCKEKKLRLHSATKTVDVNPMFHAAVQDLPTLPDSSSKCEPGRSYQVGCNKCFCSHDGNLLCTLIYCLSFTDVHERDSIKMAGTPCRDGEIVKYNCIECQCKLHLMTCSAVKDCVTYVEENLIAKYKSKGKALDLQPHETHDCIPDVIYRLKCNKCYCQKDRTMRCTTMTCLNWSETESVNKLKGKLEHHGL